METLTIAEGRLYAGGQFTRVAGIQRGAIAAFGGTGQLLSFSPRVVSTVYSIAGSGSRVYVTGAFSSMAGSPRTNAGATDLTGALLPWTPEPTWPGLGAGAALTVAGDLVVAGGQSGLVMAQK